MYIGEVKQLLENSSLLREGNPYFLISERSCSVPLQELEVMIKSACEEGLQIALITTCRDCLSGGSRQGSSSRVALMQASVALCGVCGIGIKNRHGQPSAAREIIAQALKTGRIVRTA